MTTTNYFQKSLINFQINHGEESQRKMRIMYIIDNSGSMSGSWKNVQNACRYLRKNGYNDKVLVYNSVVTEHSIEKIDQLRVEGSTDFVAVFTQIVNILKKNNEPIAFVFMTDGCDTCNSEASLNTSLNSLRLVVSFIPYPIVFHTIGFTNYHNKNFLEKITEIGHEKGCYRYAKDGESLEDKFGELFDFLTLTKLVKICLFAEDNSKVERTVEISGNEIDIVIDNPQGVIYNKVLCEDEEIELVYNEPNGFHKLQILNQEMISDEAKLNLLQSMMKEIDFKKVNKFERERLFDLKNEFQEKLNNLFKLLAETTMSLTERNNRLADINYQHKFTKNRRERLLNQRILANKNVMTDSQKKLDGLWKQLDKDKVYGPEHICFLSTLNLDQVLKESSDNLLGFPLVISRGEEIIDAPATVRIQGFSTSLISFEAFIEATKFKIYNLDAHPIQVHGGFTREAGEVVQGVNQETINAWLPLYLTPVHNTRARVLMKQVLGYFFSLNNLGYSQNQYIGLFTVLGHLVIQNDGSEAQNFILREFSKLCYDCLPKAFQALSASASLNQLAGGAAGPAGAAGPGCVGDLIQLFCSGIEFRRPFFISELVTLIGWAQCRKQNDPNWSAPEKFVDYVYEEIVRRTYSKRYHAYNDTLLLEKIELLLFGDQIQDDLQNEAIDQAHEQELHCEPQKQNYSIYTDLVNAYEKELDNGSKSNDPIVRTTIEDKSKLLNDSVKLENLEYQEFEVINDPVITSFQDEVLTSSYYKYFMKGFSKLFELPVYNDTTIRNLMVYGLTYHRNSDHNHAKVLNPIHDADNFVNRIAMTFNQKRKEKFDSRLESTKQKVISQRAVFSSHLNDFIGRILLYTPTRGGEIFSQVFSYLTDPSFKVPKRLEKLIYLIRGTYKSLRNNKTYHLTIGGQVYMGNLNEKILVRKVLDAQNYKKFLEEVPQVVSQHIYRISDIPNRHTHCNSNPNLALFSTVSWALTYQEELKLLEL